jgi:hypothetical protein
MVTPGVTRGDAWRLSSVAFAICLGAAGGCYRYQPVTVSELAPDMSVRMELSAVAVDRLRAGPDSLTRLLNGFNVSGTVSRLASDTLLLAVPTSYMEANVRLKTQLHNLPLLRSDVQRVQSRRLDRARTTWTGVALGVAIAASTAYVLDRGGRSTGGNPKPGDPPEMLIPVGLFRAVP